MLNYDRSETWLMKYVNNLNNVSPNNKSVLYNLSSCSVILSKAKEKLVVNTHKYLPYQFVSFALDFS